METLWGEIQRPGDDDAEANEDAPARRARVTVATAKAAATTRTSTRTVRTVVVAITLLQHGRGAFLELVDARGQHALGCVGHPQVRRAQDDQRRLASLPCRSPRHGIGIG